MGEKEIRLIAHSAADSVEDNRSTKLVLTALQLTAQRKL